jgi:uncharacterized Zn-finger protein
MSALKTKDLHGDATPNAERKVGVSRGQLPLHCPLPTMSLWNSHPRVFIPIEKTGKARCPYCGTDFELLPEPKG